VGMLLPWVSGGYFVLSFRVLNQRGGTLTISKRLYKALLSNRGRGLRFADSTVTGNEWVAEISFGICGNQGSKTTHSVAQQ
jgi:hypothetical protein